jgi:hypothetical protein
VNNQNESRREFVKKAAYMAPTILTLAAAPSFAKTGSTPGTTSGGGYTPPKFSNVQVQALYTWLISDPARLARLSAAAKQFSKLSSDAALKQMITTIVTTITTDLAALKALKVTTISPAVSSANLTDANLAECARALLTGV